MLPVVLAITGASGAPYAVRLLDVLARAQVPVDLIVSSHGWRLLQTESGVGDLADEDGALRGAEAGGLGHGEREGAPPDGASHPPVVRATSCAA